MSSIYYWEKLTFSKLVGKVNISERKFEVAFKSKEVQDVFGETFNLALFSWAVVPSTNPCLKFLLICFAPDIKGFYQSSLGNKVDLRDIMNVSPNILAKN